jgi:hypothetical protein
MTNATPTPTVLTPAQEIAHSARLLLSLAKAMAKVQADRIRPKTRGPEHRV